VARVLVDAAGVIETGEVADTRVCPEPPGVPRTGVCADTAARRGFWGAGQRDGWQEQGREAESEQQGDQGARLMSHAGPPSRSAWSAEAVMGQHASTARGGDARRPVRAHGGLGYTLVSGRGDSWRGCWIAWSAPSARP